MSASTFDTHAAVRSLEAAGIDTRHAEAFVAEMRAAAGADRGELVIRGELYRASWIQGAALVGSQLAIAGLIVTLTLTLLAS